MPKPLVIAVDFDGTIVDHAYPKIGQPAPGAIESLKRFNELGAKIILLTMRHGETLAEAVGYLSDNEIELWGINKNPDQYKWSASRKVYAEVYIDDAAYGCPLLDIDGFSRKVVDWGVVRSAIEAELVRRIA